MDQSGGLSPYGTQGQAGNVVQMMETTADGLNSNPSGTRAARCGYFLTAATTLTSSYRFGSFPTSSPTTIGFRVASVVPEPASNTLLTFGTLLLATRRRRGA